MTEKISRFGKKLAKIWVKNQMEVGCDWQVWSIFGYDKLKVDHDWPVKNLLELMGSTENDLTKQLEQPYKSIRCLPVSIGMFPADGLLTSV